LYRSDLETAHIGDGRYGFALVFDEPLAAGTVPEFHVDGRLWDVPNLKVEPEGTVEGWVELLAGGVVSGWAWLPHAPDERAGIEAVVDGEVVATTIAANHRPDLEWPGVRDGRQGFRIVFDPPLGDDASPEIHVRDGSGVRIGVLRQSPLVHVAPPAESGPNGRIDGFIDSVLGDAERVVTTIEKMKVLLRNVETGHEPTDLAQVVTSSLMQVKRRERRHPQD